MGRGKKILLWCVGILVVLVLFGFFGAPPILKSVLVKKLSAALNRDVFIEKISINPLTLGLKVRGMLSLKKEARNASFLLIALKRVSVLQSLRGTLRFVVFF
jgi:hypothetical protein